MSSHPRQMPIETQLSDDESSAVESLLASIAAASFIPRNIRILVHAFAERYRQFLTYKDLTEEVIHWILKIYLPISSDFIVKPKPYVVDEQTGTEYEASMGILYFGPEEAKECSFKWVLIIFSDGKQEPSNHPDADEPICDRSAEVIGFFKTAQSRDLLHRKVRYLFALSFVGLSFRIYRYDISTQHMISSPPISQYEISGLDDDLRHQHAQHILTQSGYTWLLAVFFTIYLQLGAMSGEEKVPKLPSEPFPPEARALAASMLTEDEEEASHILANMSPEEYQQLPAQPNENPATSQEPMSSVTSVTSDSSNRPETPPPRFPVKGLSGLRGAALVSSPDQYDGDRDEVGRVLESHDELGLPHTPDDQSTSLISVNDSLLVAVGDSPPQSISPPSTPPRTTIPQLTSIFDSLTLTPDEPNHVQARTRLHQNILQSGTSPIRDNTLGVHKHHHSDVPGLPMIKASASSPALLKTSVQPAPSKEDEDL